MTAPSGCVITAPTGGQAYQADETGVVTVPISGTTDASTAVSVALSPSAGGSPLTTTSAVGGGWSVTAVGVPVGDYTITATAGAAPNTVPSPPVSMHIVGLSFPGTNSSNVQALEVSANWLAGALPDISKPPTLTFDEAICRYRGTSLANGVIAALNAWAGILDPQLFVSQNTALNMIASTLMVPNAGGLDDATALWGICQKLFP